ncbi:MAG: hypothetical protein AVO33_00375 [delta proteobacterium ML8_F1]|nr:MAG: hypothetical protein AVO33_00375 [delta proteobacterium ML8_F1]
MNKMKRIPFVFTLLDYKAMEEYFEMQAVKGWMLEKINSFTMELKKIKPQSIKFAVDVFPYISAFDSYNSRAVKDYRDLCEKTGWTYVTSSNKLQVFYTKDTESYIPLQTDSVEEQRIIKKAFYSLEVLLMFILFPILLLSLGGLFPFQYDRLFVNSDIVRTIMLPLLLIPVSVYVIYYGLWFWRAKRNIKEGLSLPKASVKSAVFRGRFHLIISSLALGIYITAVILDAMKGHPFLLFSLVIPGAGLGVGLWFRKKGLASNRSRRNNIAIFTFLIIGIATVFTVFLFNVIGSQNNIAHNLVGISSEVPDGYKVIRLEDFGLEENLEIKAFSKKSSIIVPESYEYHEVSSEGTIRTHYYEVINDEISEYIFEKMLKREGSLLYRDIIEAPASDWGVDRAYYLKTDKTMILLLADNVVMMLDNEMGFSNEDVVDISKEQLGL